MGKTIQDRPNRPFNILQANRDNYMSSNDNKNDFSGIADDQNNSQI